jgi:hypothetical protein
MADQNQYPVTPLQGGSSGTLKKLNYSHDAMIDQIIANPGVTQKDLAALFGYRENSISRIFNSDAFQARLMERKASIVDPLLTMTVEEKLKALASRSLDLINDKLDATSSLDTSMKVAELATKALSYGARQGNVTVQQSFVVAMPSKSASAQEWAAAHRTPVVEQLTPGSSAS